MERIARRIAWTSAVIHGLVHAAVLLLPTLLGELQRGLGASLLEILAVANVMYLVFGLAAIPAGYLADRIGSRVMLSASAAGCAAALTVMAAAPSFPAFAAGMILLGLAAGLYHPAGLSLLSRGVASGERGRAIGIHGMGGNFGEAVAPAWAAVFAHHLGWRAGFAAAAVLSLGCVALAASLPGTAPAGRGVDAAGARPSLGDSLRAVGRTLIAFARISRLRWLFLSLIAGGLVYRGVLTFLPLHLSSSAGGMLYASYLTSGVLLAGLVAQRLGGELADRLPPEQLFLAEVVLYLPVLLLLGITSGMGLMVLALCFGFLWYLAQPLVNALTATYTESRDHGMVYGLQFAATFGVGSFATTLGGLFVAAGDSRRAFIGFAAIALLQLVAALALVRAAARAPATA